MPQPIAVGRFNHVTLNCRDVRRSVAFYQDLLGFHEVRRPNFSFPGAWLYREGVGIMLHFNEDARFCTPIDRIETRRRHVAFHVNAYDEATASLREFGVEIVERRLPDHGYRQVFFHDPDGNLIELSELPDADMMAERVGRAAP